MFGRICNLTYVFHRARREAVDAKEAMDGEKPLWCQLPPAGSGCFPTFMIMAERKIRSDGFVLMNGGKVLSDGVAGFRKTPVTAAGIRLMCMAADCDRSLGIGVTCRSCILSAAYFQCGCDRCLSRRFESPAAWSDSVGPSWGSGLTKKLF